MQPRSESQSHQTQFPGFEKKGHQKIFEAIKEKGINEKREQKDYWCKFNFNVVHLK